MKPLGLFAALVAVIVVILLVRSQYRSDPRAPAPTAVPPISASPAPTPALQMNRPSAQLASELGTGDDAQHDVIILHQIVTMYIRSLGNRQGLPIGGDRDLARVLAGHNPMHQYFLPPDHPSLSTPKHIVDRWGTPYFIHPWGHNTFEIRSAGPDRKMFTDDDLIANPTPTRR